MQFLNEGEAGFDTGPMGGCTSVVAKVGDTVLGQHCGGGLGALDMDQFLDAIEDAVDEDDEDRIIVTVLPSIVADHGAGKERMALDSGLTGVPLPLQQRQRAENMTYTEQTKLVELINHLRNEHPGNYEVRVTDQCNRATIDRNMNVRMGGPQVAHGLR